jgi:hypothetical protein
MEGAMSPAPAPSVPLFQLVRDVAQDAYKDLHATVDTLSDADADARRAKVLDYAMRTRHRVVRLLASVQWWGEYAGFHNSAGNVRDTSLSRSAAFAHAADSLWSSAQVARGAASVSPALAPAAHILGGQALFRRLPKVLEAAVGLDLAEFASVDPASDGDAGDAIVRLGTATRNLVRSVLPSDCAVLAWRVPPRQAAVRVGVINAWEADVVLDRLEEEAAVLRVLRLAVHVAPDADAVGPMRRSSLAVQPPVSQTARRALLSPEQEQPLRQMVEDRMLWAGGSVDERDLVEKPPSQVDAAARPGASDQAATTAAAVENNLQAGVESENGDSCRPAAAVAPRARRMLRELERCMTKEVAAIFAMDHVRAQASALHAHPAWRTASLATEGTSNSADPSSPVVVKYWAGTGLPASLTVLPSAEGGPPGRGGIVTVVHEPPVLGVEMPQVCVSSVNVEALVLRSMSERARQLLLAISAHCATSATDRRESETRCSTSRRLLVLALSQSGGIEVSITLKTGAWRTRAFGRVAIADDACASGRRIGWAGDRLFQSLDAVKEAVDVAVRDANDLMKVQSMLRSAQAMDIAALSRFPPGVASGPESRANPGNLCGFDPPFLAVESASPTVLLTLSSFDGSPETSIVEFAKLAEGTPSDGRRTEATINGPGIDCEPAKGEDGESVRVGDGAAVVEPRPSCGPVDGRGSDGAQRPSCRVRSLKRASTKDGLVFVQAKRSRVDPMDTEHPGSSGASTVGAVPGVDFCGDSCRAMAGLASLWSDTNVRVRRDKLLQALFDRGVVDGVLEGERGFGCPSPPTRTLLRVNAYPLPVVSAELRLLGGESWQLHLTLLTDIMDDTAAVGPGDSVSYSSETRELTLRHQDAGAAGVAKCVSDLTRARTLAALMNGVTARSSALYQVVRRSPTSVELCAADMRVGVGLTQGGYRIAIRPLRPVLQQLAQLMEEVLNAAGKSAGFVLSGLLEQACPLAAAIDMAMPSDPARCRVGFIMCVCARVVLLGQGNATHRVDVDARDSCDVIVTDYARALAVTGDAAAQAVRARPERVGYDPVPSWDLLVRELTASGRGRELPQRAGSAVAISMKMLGTVLRAVVDFCRRSALP